ncbi:MAG: P-loop NTPase fold protein [Alphaproteobacteria bacterium]|nr:P-loop NTPase fold protein [Alphaproteobacteria bacterium]
MMDIANIYNLAPEELAVYRETPFQDEEIRPGLKDFAKKLKEEIVKLPTPYVMALEGGYGTGKTFFITRFCEYLAKNNYDGDVEIKSVYLNLWENDYIANPFPVIAAQILLSLNPAHELQVSVKEKATKVANNLLKFGAKAFGGVDIPDIIPDLKKNKEDLSEFKKELQRLIEGSGGKVVLVVDELDRCKPDYAVKSLEVIKHFFDVEGLCVILTTNLDFMNNICEAHYGHPKCDINTGEGYIQKFVQSKKVLNPTTIEDYLFIIKGVLNVDTLPVRAGNFANVLERGSRENINAIAAFQNNMATVFKASQLSIRKTIDICNEILCLIDQNPENIWTKLIDGFPERILVRYFKSRGILSKGVVEPEASYRFPEDKENIRREEERTLSKLF